MKRSGAVAIPVNSEMAKDALDALQRLEEAQNRIVREDEAIRKTKMDSGTERTLRLLRILNETVKEQISYEKRGRTIQASGRDRT